jgi:low temperature requirement protein LtrA
MLVKRMLARDPAEPHRVSTPLELLFDLCFVVAVSQAASHLHHAMADGHLSARELFGYAGVFFTIWWAWMNFTWFASAYDCDDVPYRLAVLIQIAGVLVIAAGVSTAFEHGDYAIMTVGYAIMRVGLVSLWLRAGLANPSHRRTAFRYAFGIAAIELGWLGVLLLPHSLQPWSWLVGAPLELALPWWAESAGATPWHPHHITERYGLLTLIVLGESVLSAATAIEASIENAHFSLSMLGVIVGGLLTMFSMWWLYFDQGAPHDLRSKRQIFSWAYGHYFLFAATAGVGAGLAAAADVASGESHLGDAATSAMVATPLAIFLVWVWLLEVRPRSKGRLVELAFVLAAGAAFATGMIDASVFAIGLVMVALVAVVVVLTQRRA